MTQSAPQNNDKTRARISGIFDRASITYDRVGPRFFSYFGQRLVDLLEIPAGGTILDVATGTGQALLPAAECAGSSGRAVGIDLSRGMVKGASAEIRRRSVNNAWVHVMDAEQLAFCDATFDRVICGEALFFFPDQARALAEMYRVLKPGGRIGISTWLETDDDRWTWYGDLFTRYLTPPDAPKNPPAQPAPPPSRHSPFGLSREPMLELLGEAGFRKPDTFDERVDFAYPDAETWWSAQWSRMTRSVFESLSPEDLERFKAEAMASAKRMEEQNSLYETHHALYTLAVRPGR